MQLTNLTRSSCAKCFYHTPKVDASSRCCVKLSTSFSVDEYSDERRCRQMLWMFRGLPVSARMKMFFGNLNINTEQTVSEYMNTMIPYHAHRHPEHAIGYSCGSSVNSSAIASGNTHHSLHRDTVIYPEWSLETQDRQLTPLYAAVAAIMLFCYASGEF